VRTLEATQSLKGKVVANIYPSTRTSSFRLNLSVGIFLTIEAATNLLKAEDAAKRQKFIDSKIKKRHREETRKNEQLEKEKNRVLKALKKYTVNE